MPLSDDERIDQIAAAQLGLVTRAQLLAAGVSRHAIARRVATRRLRLLHRGVYRVGPVVAPYTRELAAVLACGPDAVVSHRSAGWLWRIVPDPGDAMRVDIILRNGDRGRRPNIRVHRMRLDADDVTVRDGIPVTTPGRTLLDLAATLPLRELERAVAEAERANLFDHRDLACLAGRYAGRPGAPKLRRLLARDAPPAFTRWEAEERLLALVRKAQLPAPEMNVRVADHEVDFFWRRERLVVEVDGFAFHATSRNFEQDRLRDARLAAIGVHVVRVTWRQLTREPEATLVRLALTLGRSNAGPALQELR